MINFISLFFAAIIGLYIGNLQGDQATLRDCAAKGEAALVGGGTVICSVKKEQP